MGDKFSPLLLLLESGCDMFKKKEYKLITKYKGKEETDICGTFWSMICLLISKVWGSFEVMQIERVCFYE